METKKINCKVGETFTVGGIEFIRFPEQEGKVPAVAKDILFCSRFGDDNNLHTSDVLKRLKEEVLPKIVEAVGDENVCTFETDLTTLDGLKPYANLESKINLVTLDFYRKHVAIFDAHKADEWWWLANPESALPHDNPWWTLCVAPSGCVNYNCYDVGYGVRPFLIFLSSIFESSEE